MCNVLNARKVGKPSTAIGICSAVARLVERATRRFSSAILSSHNAAFAIA